MNVHTETRRPAPNAPGPDPISLEIDAAVREHRQAGAREREGFDTALVAIHQLLDKLGPRH